MRRGEGEEKEVERSGRKRALLALPPSFSPSLFILTPPLFGPLQGSKKGREAELTKETPIYRRRRSTTSLLSKREEEGG